MDLNPEFAQVASGERLQKTAEALKQNGMEALVTDTGEDARQKVLEIIPAGARVFNMTSVTLDTIGISEYVMESGRYQPVRKELELADNRRKRELAAAPDWAIGSVHAVTEEGRAVIASATGSQLPAYAYGAEKVVWIVGGQKIVEDLNEAFRRIYEYVFFLEDERARKAYGVGSGVNKLLVINKEIAPNRITVILVREKLGF
jgi:L-lactate utilization protein LutC